MNTNSDQVELYIINPNDAPHFAKEVRQHWAQSVTALVGAAILVVCAAAFIALHGGGF